MVELIKRYMRWYEDKEKKKKEAAIVSENKVVNVKQYIKNDIKQKMSIINWLFSYQNIFTYILKNFIFMTLFFCGFQIIANTTTQREVQLVLGQLFVSLFLPFFSFGLVAFAKGLKNGVIFMFPTCIVTLPCYLIWRMVRKKG